jgi:hypothetical protein
MLTPVESQHDDLSIHNAEIDCVRKTRQHRSSGFAVRSLERQRIRRHARNEFIDNSTPSPSRRASYHWRISSASSSA